MVHAGAVGDAWPVERLPTPAAQGSADRRTSQQAAKGSRRHYNQRPTEVNLATPAQRAADSVEVGSTFKAKLE